MIDFWLQNVLGIETAAASPPDLVHKVLKRYGLLSRTQFREESSIEDKFRQLQQPLKSLGIEFDSALISHVKAGNPKAIESVLTQVYLRLAPSCPNQFQRLKKLREAHDVPGTRFSCLPVELVSCQDVELELAPRVSFKEVHERRLREQCGDGIEVKSRFRGSPAEDRKRRLVRDMEAYDKKVPLTESLSFGKLVDLQAQGEAMEPEFWNPSKYEELKALVGQTRLLKDDVVRSAKNLLLNAVLDSIEENERMKEQKRKEDILKDTRSERKLKKKLRAGLDLDKMEEVHVREKLLEVKEARKREQKEACKKKFWKKRQVLEQDFLRAKSLHERQRNLETKRDLEMIAGLIESLVGLAEICGSQRFLPQKVLDDWRTLSFHSKPLYWLPSNENLAPVLRPIMMEDESLQFLQARGITEYECLLGPWETQPMKPPEAQKTREILGCFEKMLERPQFLVSPNFGRMKVRALLHSNIRDVNEKETFLDLLTRAFSCRKVLVIDMDQLIKEAVALHEKEAASCVQDDDGFCEEAELPEAAPKAIEPAKPKKKPQKSNLKRASDKGSSSSKKTLKSVNISESNSDNFIKPRLTSHQTMTPSWGEKRSPVARTAAKIAAFFAGNEEVPSYLKLELLVSFLNSQDEANGFILVDFPLDLEEIEALEGFFSGEKVQFLPKKFYEQDFAASCGGKIVSFLTHFIRMENYTPLWRGLNYDEVPYEHFCAIKSFYEDQNVYYTVPFEEVGPSLVQNVAEMVAQNMPTVSRVFNHEPGQMFTRIPRTLRRADVELQVSFPDKSESDEDPGEECKRNWVENLSKFYALEQLDSWEALTGSYRDKVAGKLAFRMEFEWELAALKIWHKAVRESCLKAELDDGEVLLDFTDRFNELDMFYRKDEEGQTYLLGLISRLKADLNHLAYRAEVASKTLIKRLIRDDKTCQLGTLLVWTLRKLLHSELIRFVSSTRFLCELFSFLLQEELNFETPSLLTPQSTPSKTESIEKNEENLEEEECSTSSSDSFEELEIPDPTFLIESQKFSFEEAVESHKKTVENILDQLKTQVCSGFSENLKRSSLSVPKIRKRKSDRASVASKRSSVSTFSESSVRDEAFLLKSQLLECVQEQLQIANFKFESLKSRAFKDLNETIRSFNEFLLEFKAAVELKRKKQDDRTERLVQDLVEAVDQIALGVCILSNPEEGDYGVSTFLHVSPAPSELTATESELQVQFLATLTDFLVSEEKKLYTPLEFSVTLTKFLSTCLVSPNACWVDTPEKAQHFLLRTAQEMKTEFIFWPDFIMAFKKDSEENWELKLEPEALYVPNRDSDSLKNFGVFLSLGQEKAFNVDFEVGEEYLKLVREVRRCREILEEDLMKFTRALVCSIIQDFPEPLESVTSIQKSPRVSKSSVKSVKRKRSKKSSQTSSARTKSVISVETSRDTQEEPPEPSECLLSPQKPKSLDPVERFLDLKRRLPCGCPIQEPACDASKKLAEPPFSTLNFMIDLKTLQEGLCGAFPWHQQVQSDVPLPKKIEKVFLHLLEEHQKNNDGEEGKVAVHLLVHNEEIRNLILSNLRFKLIGE